MLKSKAIRLFLLAGGAVFALGGCSSGWLPWVVGAGLAAWFATQQQA